MSAPERRIEQRLRVNFPVSVVAAAGKQVRRAQNLSVGGVQIQRGLDPLKPGERVELVFRLPRGDGMVCCEGTVVYDRDRMVGLSFSSMPLFQRAALWKFVTQHGDDADRAVGNS